MSEPADALHRLESVAPEFGATLTVNDAQAASQITVTLPSGQQHVFALELTDDGERISVREAPVGHRLPGFCPDRHINSDCSFCLGWGVEDPGIVANMDDARSWWSAVVRFLTHQLSATKRGVWPGRENDRAHGNAARHQAIAEPLAAQFGPTFVRDLYSGDLTVRSDGRRRNPRLELHRSGRRIARVFLHSQRLTPERILCPCGESAATPITKCGEHSQTLAHFTVALYWWRHEERNFLRTLVSSGQHCCGTLRECGLRGALDSARAHASSRKGPLHERHARARTRRARR